MDSSKKREYRIHSTFSVLFILDHIGKPDIKNRLFESWATEIKELAEF